MAPRLRLRRIVAPLVGVGLAAAAVYGLVLAGRGGGRLTASGTVEAVEIRLAPEIGGRVVTVSVEVGQPVSPGDTLLTLDDSLLQSQRARAEAAVATAAQGLLAAERQQEVARIQLEIARAASRGQSRAHETLSWQLEAPGEVDLPIWYWRQEERLRGADEQVNAAEAAVVEASRRLESLLADPSYRTSAEAESALAQAQAAYLAADAVYRRAYAARDPADLFGPAEDLRQAAREALAQAQADLDELADDERYAALRAARGELAAAEARRFEAEWLRDGLRLGPWSLELELAEARHAQTSAAVGQARAALDQAEAELASLTVQLARTVVSAPAEGVVLTRSVEPGEVLPAGATALTLGLLDDLRITVFLPEDRYGQVDLGERVEVRVDSYPQAVFEGEVVRIADRAEFTPRNVQTEEGRRTTVFAVEIVIESPGGRLKPGMPADVTFAADR